MRVMRFSCVLGSAKSTITREKMRRRAWASMENDSIIRKILKRDRVLTVVGHSDKTAARAVPRRAHHFSHLSEIAWNSPFDSARCSH
ncbi:hypothetical protein DIE07_11240 [Burkholderia sp. Bp9002]|nr:hypothetical protein DIE18_14200 [Burkholderia sp. Bp9125]RQS11321.1 hypothetical protein DIE07_11240 [Burkholderia sp. Bp9002]